MANPPVAFQPGDLTISSPVQAPASSASSFATPPAAASAQRVDQPALTLRDYKQCFARALQDVSNGYVSGVLNVQHLPNEEVTRLLGPWSYGFEYFGCTTLDQFFTYLRRIENNRKNNAYDAEDDKLNQDIGDLISFIKSVGGLLQRSHFQNALFAETMIRLNTYWAETQATVIGGVDQGAVRALDLNPATSPIGYQYTADEYVAFSKDKESQDRSRSDEIQSVWPPELLLYQLAELCRQKTTHIPEGACASFVHISKKGRIVAGNVGDTSIALFIRNRETRKIETVCLSVEHNLYGKSHRVSNPLEQARFGGLERNPALHCLQISRAFGECRFQTEYPAWTAQTDMTRTDISQFLQKGDVDIFVLAATDGLSKWISLLGLGKLLEKECEDILLEHAEHLPQRVNDIFKRVAQQATQICRDDTTLRWRHLTSLPEQDEFMAVFDSHAGSACADKLADITHQWMAMPDKERDAFLKAELSITSHREESRSNIQQSLLDPAASTPNFLAGARIGPQTGQAAKTKDGADKIARKLRKEDAIRGKIVVGGAIAAGVSLLVVGGLFAYNKVRAWLDRTNNRVPRIEIPQEPSPLPPPQEPEKKTYYVGIDIPGEGTFLLQGARVRILPEEANKPLSYDPCFPRAQYRGFNKGWKFNPVTSGLPKLRPVTDAEFRILNESKRVSVVPLTENRLLGHPIIQCKPDGINR